MLEDHSRIGLRPKDWTMKSFPSTQRSDFEIGLDFGFDVIILLDYLEPLCSWLKTSWP